MIIRRYTSADEKKWNEFVSTAKNGVFLFSRRYLDYHSNRFTDHSLLLYAEEKLVALLAANEENNVIYSHGGLTYGGLILEKDVTLEEVLRYFYHILKYYSTSFKSLEYKCIPSEFAPSASQEDLYAMFLLKGELIGRQTNCVFDRESPLPYRTLKKRSIAKSEKTGDAYSIVSTNDPTEFWSKVLIPNLRDRFGAEPTHTAGEMKLLIERFPKNIHVYEIRGKDILAGTVVFEMDNIVHTQYLSATEEGKEAGALDVLIDNLVAQVFTSKRFFSLGTSNEDQGRKLNRGLMAWKEGFGARTHVRDMYRVDMGRYLELKDYE